MKRINYIGGEWVEGNPAVLGPHDQSFWFASQVFDGARAFEGVAPDLDRHCQRALDSARHMGYEPNMALDEMIRIALEGCARFPAGEELYIRPIFYPESGFLYPDPDSTRFIMAIHVEPLPDASGFAACLSGYRRPAPDSAPTLAKASALYPTTGMAIKQAMDKGFANAVMLDHENNVAEFATANLWIVKDGVACTPVWNGCFLNGITRRRVIALLGEDGVEVVERTMSWDEVVDADEIFSTGNFAKVKPVNRIERRELQPGPVFRRARELYWDYARTSEFKVAG